MSAVGVHVDVIPPRCTVEGEPDPENGTVRFRATDAEGRVSAWSGWFPARDGEVIELLWLAFDFDTQ